MGMGLQVKEENMNIHKVLYRGARTVQKLLESNPFFCITDEEAKTGRKDSLEDGVGQGWGS